MSNVDVMAMFDNGWGFGIMAVLIFPLLFAYVTKQKSAKGVAALIICCIIVFIASWMSTRYEIIVAFHRKMRYTKIISVCMFGG